MAALLICRRELEAYFRSFTAYLLLAFFLLLSGYFFYSDLIFFVLVGGFVLPSGLWQFVFLDMRLVLLVVLPLVTMRSFSEEKKLGTIELLWTYPVRDRDIVAGKFLAAWTFFLLMLLPTAAPIGLLWFLHPFAPLPVAAAYLGVVLLATAFLTLGLFVSTLTENQIVSAMSTYAILLLLWFLNWNEEIASEALLPVLRAVSLFDRFHNFTRGVIDTRDVLFLLGWSGFFLLLTLESLASRSWRGVR